jgi:aspartate aminotransferase
VASYQTRHWDVLVSRLSRQNRTSSCPSSTLLPPEQCDALYLKRNIQILPEGCVSLGALNAPKIDQLARGIDLVVREGIKEAEEARKHAIAMELALQAAKEQAAREEAEAQAALAAAEEERAREQDTLMMEESIASAMEAQKRMEEEEKMREEADREMVETLRKAEERAAIARQAEAILASITGAEL